MESAGARPRGTEERDMTRVVADRPMQGEIRLKMTYEEYLRDVDYSAHAEWVDGEVTIFMPPGSRHQRVLAFLITTISVFLGIDRRSVVLPCPFEMKLREGRSCREPDLLVVLNEHRERLTPQRLEGPADLVIEILSPESVTRDRVVKFRELEQEGVPEYWIVDARTGQYGVVAYWRGPDGRYQPIEASDGRLDSHVLDGFWLDIAWLTGEELPSELDVLRSLAPSIFAS
jgi:Uma2 family endonuclease